jgi:rod shape-determining protein MreD
MRVLIYLATALALTTLETSLLHFVSIDFVRPDACIPFIIYTTFFMGPKPGLVTATGVGLLQEAFSSAPAGSLVFTKIVVFIMALIMRNRIYIDSKYSFSYVCTGAVVAESLVFLALSFLARGETGNIANVLLYLAPNAIMTGFLSIFIFSLIEQVNLKYSQRG